MFQDDEGELGLRNNDGVETNVYLSNSSLRNTCNAVNFDINVRDRVAQVKDSFFVMDGDEDGQTDDGVQEFEVHAERINGVNYFMDNGFDDELYCSTPPMSDNETDGNHEATIDQPLYIKRLQKVSWGCVINSNVFLTENQWNTLILDEDINQIYCVLCDEYLDIDTGIVHLEDEVHKTNIELHVPIKRFELSITRKIRNKYHCAVCNEVFDDTEDSSHVDNQKHGDNMLFAINKASDIVYDYNLENSYEVTVDIATNDIPRNVNDIPRNVNDRPVQMSVDNNEKPPYEDDNFSTPSNDYENDVFYDDYFEPQVFGVSYAAMASKAKIKELPTNYRIDLGNKEVLVKFNSWHMIMYYRTNEMYCMACQVFDHKRNKREHCQSTSHLQRLKQCDVINAYETHLIRRVGDSLYHCGHCNNLQPISEMENHIVQFHPSTNKISKRNVIKINGTPIKFGEPTKLKDNDFNNHFDDKENINTENELSTNDVNNLQSIIIQNPNLHQTMTNVRIDEHLTNLDKKVITNGANLLYKRNTKFLKEHAKQFFNNIDVQVKLQDNLITNESNNPESIKSYSKVTATTSTKKPVNKENAAPQNQTTNPFIYTPLQEDIIKAYIPNIPQIYPNNTRNINDKTLLTSLQFGTKLSVSLLSFNTILKPCELFCCCSCDLMIKEKHLLAHVLDEKHIKSIQSVPYDAEYSFNLIRKIKKFIHCGICNIILPSDKTFVLNHNVSTEHTELLRKALGFERNNSTIVPKTKHKVSNSNEKVLKIYSNASNQYDNVTSCNDNVSNNNNEETLYVINCDNNIESNNGADLEDFTGNKDDLDVSPTDYILAKLKDIFIKVKFFSWHTLVVCGDGTNYCFLCAIHIDCDNHIQHIKTKNHLNNIEEHKVLVNYGANMIRQIESQYHCANCNVTIDKKRLKYHLEWPKHRWHTQSSNSNNKNALGVSGVKEIDLITQKEKTRGVKNNSKFNIVLDLVIKSSEKSIEDNTPDGENDEDEKDKIIKTNSKANRFNFENWHGLVSFKSGLMCKLCGVNIGRDDALRHVEKPKHLQHLKKPFLENYPEAYIRQLSDTKLHCIVCNIELSATEDVNQHIHGKKHRKHQEHLLIE